MGGREEVTPFRILEALPTKWRTGGPEATEVITGQRSGDHVDGASVATAPREPPF